MVSIGMNPQHALDLAVQPSPVLMQAVVKVEQVVARLQELQSTIAGLKLSPCSLKHSRASRSKYATARMMDLNGCTSSKDSVAPITPGGRGHRSSKKDKCSPKVDRRSPKVDRRSPKVDKSSPKVDPQKLGGWKNWSSPANQVHDVISEILMASQFAKEVATIVADVLQERPAGDAKEPVKPVEEPVERQVSTEARRKETADLLSKAPVHHHHRHHHHKIVTTKSSPTQPKSVHTFKVVVPSDGPAKIAPAANPSWSKDQPRSMRSSPPYRRRATTECNVSKLPSSSKEMMPRRSQGFGQSSEKRRRSHHKRMDASTASSSDSEDEEDVENSLLSNPSTEVTEIKGQLKPWKRTTPIKGVLFSNPVYISSPSPSPSPARTSTGRRKSWLANPLPKARDFTAGANNAELSASKQKAKSPLSPFIPKPSFKRDGASKSGFKADSATLLTKRDNNLRKPYVFPPSRYVEVPPKHGPGNGSVMTVMDVLSTRSTPDVPIVPAVTLERSSRQMLMPLDPNVRFGGKPAAVHVKEPVKNLLQTGVPQRSHNMPLPSFKTPVGVHRKPPLPPQQMDDADSDKENDQVPSCTPAVMFLRSLSTSHSLNKSTPRRHSVCGGKQWARFVGESGWSHPLSAFKCGYGNGDINSAKSESLDELPDHQTRREAPSAGKVTSRDRVSACEVHIEVISRIDGE